MTRRDDAAFAAEVLERARRELGGAARYRAGTCESTTDAQGDVQVRLDGRGVPAGSAGGDDGASLSVDDPEDLGAAIYCRVLCDPPALGQRVIVMTDNAGAAWVIGSPGGTPRLLEGIVLPNNGDLVPSLEGDADTDIDLLSLDVSVPHLRHWVELEVQVVILAETAGTGIGRIWRESISDADLEDPSTERVVVGRYHIGPVAEGNGTLCHGAAVDFVDPGDYRYFASFEIDDGFAVRQDLGDLGEQAVAGWMKATDQGALPGSTAWPDDTTALAE